MLKVLNTVPMSMLKVKCGSTPLVKGELATFSSGTAVPGTAGIATQIILGVVADNTVAGAITPIYSADGVDIEVDIYQGGTVKVFAAADIGALFDVVVTSHDFTIDPNDTTGAFCMLMSYDNNARKARVRIPKTFLYC